MKGASRGFSLLEATVAVGIFALLCAFTLRLIGGSLHWAALTASRNADAASVGELVDRWHSEEDSAWAIFTPPNDVNGASNADDHELDFFNRDGKNNSYFWAYTYDSAAQKLTRYLYAAPGGKPVADGTYTGITKFVAHTYPVTALQDRSTPVYSPLYDTAALQPGVVRFYPAAAPWIDGGNQITFLHIETASQVREMQLSTLTAPSGFTIMLRYTPSPAPTAPSATGPLVTLGKIVFEPASLAYDSPSQRLARGLNALFGGGTASAAGTTCSYAQLFLQDGTADVNSEDGFNATDSQGCVTDATVRLWARESGYSGMFGYVFPASGNCEAYISISSSQWPSYSSSVVSPTSGTSGCNVTVQSSDKTPSNGGAASVVAVVNEPLCINGIDCYAYVQSISRHYIFKCAGGGQLSGNCPGGGTWTWDNTFTITQYSSSDGGSTWNSLGVAYSCGASAYGSTPTCQPSKKASPIAYSGTCNSTLNGQTGQLSGPTCNWTPSTPPSTP